MTEQILMKSGIQVVEYPSLTYKLLFITKNTGFPTNIMNAKVCLCVCECMLQRIYVTTTPISIKFGVELAYAID